MFVVLNYDIYSVKVIDEDTKKTGNVVNTSKIW
jgi:hypothetical protein